jgi:hypothetical protein
MPCYQFDLIAPSGSVLATVTLPLPVAERDQVILRRRSVPDSVGLAGCTADPARPDRQILAAYRRIESRLGNNREFHRRIGHTPAQIKRAWGQE